MLIVFSMFPTPHCQELRPHGATLQRRSPRSPRAVEDGGFWHSRHPRWRWRGSPINQSHGLIHLNPSECIWIHQKLIELMNSCQRIDDSWKRNNYIMLAKNESTDDPPSPKNHAKTLLDMCRSFGSSRSTFFWCFLNHFLVHPPISKVHFGSISSILSPPTGHQVSPRELQTQFAAVTNREVASVRVRQHAMTGYSGYSKIPWFPHLPSINVTFPQILHGKICSFSQTSQAMRDAPTRCLVG